MWEDIQEILPHILEPVPAPLLHRIEPGRQAHQWKEYLSNHLFPVDDLDNDSLQDEGNWKNYNQAIGWLDQRKLSTDYLQNGPQIWFWTDGNLLNISWDHEDALFEEVPLWASQAGKFSMPLHSFIDELTSFDQRLIQAMQDRVKAIQKDWPHPNISIDVDALVREHHDRASWMKNAIERARLQLPTQWDLVVNSLERLGQKGFPAPF